MEGLELYSFFVCLIVYVLLIVVFTLIISSIYSMNIKLIRHGIEDERILKELHNKRKSKTVMQIVSTIISVLFSMCFVCIFIFSLYVKYIDPTPSSDIPVLRIVKSDSMSYKDEDNEYLFENDINNQFDTFDLIFTYQLPDEYELELYDIVVYEVNGEYIIHRIVGIEEPNSLHPDCRHFLLQGDAIKSPDYFPVTYGQMRAIYNGDKIPFVGSFISFLQSPAGVLCIILVIFYAIITPLLNLKIEQEEVSRYHLYINHHSTNEQVIIIDEIKKKSKITSLAEKKSKSKGLKVDEIQKGKGLSTNKKISIIIIIFLVIIVSYSISNVNASWNYAQGPTNEIEQVEDVLANWPIISTKGEQLAAKIVSDPTNGLNNSNSYLNKQISSRMSTSNGGRRDTIGSMAVTQGDGLDEDFDLTANNSEFLLQFKDDNGDGEVDYYYLFITDVYLGECGTINWWGTNKTPGSPTTPIGEYIYAIYRYKVTKDNNGEWVAGAEEVGSAKSAWYEESRSNANATQIPSFDPDTWVAGNMNAS